MNMKTRTKYIEPEIELIRLDNEISLQLASSSPDGEPDEGEWLSHNTDQFNVDSQQNFRG
jgi:hypothetical protein